MNALRLYPAQIISLLLFLLSLANPAYSENTLIPERDWQLVKDRNGIQVYMAHRDESRVKTFRGKTRMTLKDEYAVVALLNDYDSFPKWMHFISGVEEISRDSEVVRYVRIMTRLPWPLKDREAVGKVFVRQHFGDDSEYTEVLLTNMPNLIPLNDDYVRLPEIYGRFRFTRLGNRETEIIYEVILDPGGYIPSWLANMIAGDIPFFTLDKLRRILLQPKYQGKYYDYIDLHGPGRPEGLPPPRGKL